MSEETKQPAEETPEEPQEAPQEEAPPAEEKVPDEKAEKAARGKKKKEKTYTLTRKSTTPLCTSMMRTLGRTWYPRCSRRGSCWVTR